MTESNSAESNLIMNAPKRNVQDEPEVLAPTQQELKDQMKKLISLLARQIEDLTGLIQGMTTAQHPTADPRMGTGHRFSVARYQPGTKHPLVLKLLSS